MTRYYQVGALAFCVLYGCASGGGPSPYVPPPIQEADSGTSGTGGDPDGSGYQVPGDDSSSGTSEDATVASIEDATSGGYDVSLPALVTCPVTFTVNGVTWPPPEGGAVDDAGSRAVYVVGSDSALGGTIPIWTISEGLLLTQQTGAPGTWTGSVMLTNQETIIFKFVEVSPQNPAGWESLGAPYTDRSLTVECSFDGGVEEPGTGPAGPDGGPPALGDSYTGTFGVRPPDANGP